MFPKKAPRKPLKVNYAASNKIILAVFGGISVLGGGLAYAFELMKPSDSRDPSLILAETYKEDRKTFVLTKKTFVRNVQMVREYKDALEEKYMPKALRDAAKQFDVAELQKKSLAEGDYGNFVVTKSPSLKKSDTEQISPETVN